jgi:hypothetical protein
MAGCAILSAIGGGIAITCLLHLNAAGAAYVNVVPADERATLPIWWPMSTQTCCFMQSSASPVSWCWHC